MKIRYSSGRAPNGPSGRVPFAMSRRGSAGSGLQVPKEAVGDGWPGPSSSGAGCVVFPLAWLTPLRSFGWDSGRECRFERERPPPRTPDLLTRPRSAEVNKCSGHCAKAAAVGRLQQAAVDKKSRPAELRLKNLKDKRKRKVHARGTKAEQIGNMAKWTMCSPTCKKAS